MIECNCIHGQKCTCKVIPQLYLLVVHSFGRAQHPRSGCADLAVFVLHQFCRSLRIAPFQGKFGLVCNTALLLQNKSIRSYLHTCTGSYCLALRDSTRSSLAASLVYWLTLACPQALFWSDLGSLATSHTVLNTPPRIDLTCSFLLNHYFLLIFIGLFNTSFIIAKWARHTCTSKFALKVL